VLFSKISKLEPLSEEDKKLVWKCEFCYLVNEDIMIDEEEVNQYGETVDYLLTPPEEIKEENSLVILCVDTSGSMCVTQEVPSTHVEWKKLKMERGDKKSDKNYKAVFVEAGIKEGISKDNQYLPREKKRRHVCCWNRLFESCIRLAFKKATYRIS